MIIIRLFGGLGNQLFQYAFGRRLSILNNSRLKLDIETGFNDDFYNRKYCLKYFNINEDFADENIVPKFFFKHTESVSTIGKIKRKINLIMPYSKDVVVFEKDIENANNDLLFNGQPKYFIGYWQKIKYFEGIENTLRNEFSLKNKLSGENLRTVEKIQSTNSVAVHFRKLYGFSNGRTLQKHIDVHGILSNDYYKEAIDFLCERYTDLHFFIFSDNYKWVKENFNFYVPFTIVSHNDDAHNYEDLRLMSSCKHNIIANSSFSWWAGWLNNNPNKIVIAPNRWFNKGNYSSADLISEEWIRI